MATELDRMAVRAAREAVNESHPFTQEEYYGDRFHPGVSTIEGLAEEVVDLYYEEYSNRKPTFKLFKEIAEELI